MASTQDADIVATYHRLLRDDPDITMPVAAIEALIHSLAHHPATTISETLDLVSKLTAQLKANIPNSISLSAGSDLFQQYLITSLQRPGSSLDPVTSSTSTAVPDFDQVRAHLVQNGKLFVQRAKAARATIAELGKQFVRDGDTVLTFGGSRVVGALLRRAAAPPSDAPANPSRSSVRFRVIYVVPSPSTSTTTTTTTTTTAPDEGATHIAALRALGVPVAVIPATAIAFSLDQVTQCFVGAEGVVENGGVVSRLGTYQLGVLAKAAGKPFYVVAESHKFVRLFPLSQSDLGLQQNVIEFRSGNEGTGSGGKDGGISSVGDEGIADMDGAAGERAQGISATGIALATDQAVDYTPPNLISGIVTESGVLLPSAVSEELIKIWF